MATERTGTGKTAIKPGKEEITDVSLTGEMAPRVATTPAPRPTVKMPEMGALDPFMKDPEVTEIMVNDLRNVMIERQGKMVFSGYSFQSVEELNRLTRNILDITGRILSPDSPYVDTMLPDGSRVNIVGAPLTMNGPCITIRKFPSHRLKVTDLMEREMLDKRMAYFLKACTEARINIVIAGGTGSGKTTLLNALLGFVPKDERLITIEDTPELVIKHTNSVRMQTKPQTPGSAAIGARELVANALRMRPDRIVVGECRRGEAFDMLQAMNTGHAGSMTTIHANSPRDALGRVETLCLTAGVDLPLIAVRKQMASAIDILIQVKRFRNGKRRVTAITEVTGMEGDIVTLQDIFQFDTPSAPSQNADLGSFKSSGFVPTLLSRLTEAGAEFPAGFFN